MIEARVEGLLGGLDSDQRATVMKCAVIWELDVEEPERADSQVAMGHLRHVVADRAHLSAALAWDKLTTAAGRIARVRGGHTLTGWLDVLHGEGIGIGAEGSFPAAALEARRQVLDRYAERVKREASEIDLRALGAELPPVRMEDADAHLQVGKDPDDERQKGPLLWTFLRRGRVVLTGLPGGGKSTALKQLAAHLVSDPTLPLPVRVSLREIQMGSPRPGLREQIVELAVRDSPRADQPILAEEIHTRLDRDEPIALLLDSLDETYNRRAQVVSEISRLVAGLPDGVCILLATRDVAYGQAATLGWPSVRLLPPSDIMPTVAAILVTAAEHTVPDAAARSEWVDERVAWVGAALDRDHILKETPLIPALLSLLSVRRSVDRLPTRRAEILRAVVNDFLAERELHPGNDRTLGPLDGRAAGQAGLTAFAIEAATILSSQGQATEDEVANAIASNLQDAWGLPHGRARQTASDVVRVLDEAGIFVLSSEGGPVVPRIALLAEVGDAMHAAEHPDQLNEWVEQRVAGQQFEPLILACVLAQAAVGHAAGVLERDLAQFGVALALAQAAVEGAVLDDSVQRLVCRSLIDHVADGTREGWRAWRRLIDLPIPHDLFEQAVSAAGRHSPEHAIAARVSLKYYAGSNFSEADVGLLREVLALRYLSHSPSSGAPASVFDWLDDPAGQALNDAQLIAATKLLELAPDAVSLVAERATSAPSTLSNLLTDLLTDHGYQDEVQKVREAKSQEESGASSRLTTLLKNFSETNYEHPLHLIADHPRGALSTRQEIRLDELADFLATLHLGSGGSFHFIRSEDEILNRTIALTASLYGFDRQVLAAEAAIAATRVQRWGTGPFWALFDQAEERTDADWSTVADPADAVKLLGELFMFNLGVATFAAISLYEAPVAEIAAPMLRDLMPKLKPSPDHERLGAIVLASLAGVPEPQCWESSDDPVLREVAALAMEPANGRYQQFLDDPDGRVREVAIEEIATSLLPNRITLLERAAERPAPGWMCRSCRTMNPPGSTACTKDGCFRAAANPAKKAREALAKLARA